MERYTTQAARQELALRQAAKTGNRHMRRKGAKVFRNVPPPRPWFVFEHPSHGTVGIRPTDAGTSVEMRLPTGLSDDDRAEVISWALCELKQLAASRPAPDVDDAEIVPNA